MKLTLVDQNNQEHDVENVLTEFAQIHNMHSALLGAYDQRLAAIEAMLGIEHPTADAQQVTENE
jgi:hypothetical protein